MSRIKSQLHLFSTTYGPANPAPPGGSITPNEAYFTSPGTFTWTAPEQAAWTNVSIVVVNGGGRGPVSGGAPAGALGYGNNIPVTYGQSYTVVVGNGQNGTSYISIGGQTLSGSSGGLRDGGGAGGLGGPYSNGWFVDGGGGAGGYSGSGGRGGGGSPHSGLPQGHGSPGQGGGGGGGGGAPAPSSTYTKGGNGGGVGLHGEGPNGSGGNGAQVPGSPGSPGGSGSFGWGHGSERNGGQSNPNPTPGGPGGVRIVWGGPPAPSGGTNRIFPTTNVS